MINIFIYMLFYIFILLLIDIYIVRPPQVMPSTASTSATAVGEHAHVRHALTAPRAFRIRRTRSRARVLWDSPGILAKEELGQKRRNSTAATRSCNLTGWPTWSCITSRLVEDGMGIRGVPEGRSGGSSRAPWRWTVNGVGL